MKILSLDDHPLFGSGLKSSLTACNLGFEVISTQHHEEAINVLQADVDIDLLILDLSMPGFNGLHFMRAILSRNINTPIVIMSASEDLYALHEAFRLGAIGFLPKNLSLDELTNALLKIQQGEVFVPHNIAAGLAKISEKARLNVHTHLSNRQLDILKMVRDGLTNQSIAEVFNISEATVKSHLQNIFKTLGSKNRIDCIQKAENAGLFLDYVKTA